MNRISLKQLKTLLPDYIKLEGEWLGLAYDATLMCMKCKETFVVAGKHINKDMKCPKCEKELIFKRHIKEVMQRHGREVDEVENDIYVDNERVDLTEFTLANYQIKTIKLLITKSTPLFSS